MNKDNFYAPKEIAGWQNIALGIGGIATIVILVAALVFPGYRQMALRGWLLGFIFWGGLCFGSIGILLLQYLTGGAWGVVIRRVAEAASRTLWIVALLFLPIMFGVGSMYEWTHPEPYDLILAHKAPYLNVTFWVVRAVLYFVIFGVMVYLLNMWSAQQDQAASYEEAANYLGRATAFSGPTMVVFVLTVTFATVDWVMSLDPHWFSTIWGLLFVVGWALSSFSFAVIILAYFFYRAPMNRVLGKRHFHDIGKLMLALVMVWAYFNFSQYLIIWSGNLPEETTWYVTRQQGGWGVIGLVLIVLHFAFPFLVLLNREIKRNPKWLARLAIFILVMRLVDMYYNIGPSPLVGLHGDDKLYVQLFERLTVFDFIGPLAVGGIWLWWYFRELQKRPLVPVMDPFLENAIEHGKGH